MQLLSYPRQPLENLSLVDRRNPVRLFEEVMQDFAAFQTDMFMQKQDWAHVVSYTGTTSISQEDITTFITAREVLALPTSEAIVALCTPTPYAMGERVEAGMHSVLENGSTLRYAIAGHTHQMRFVSIPDEVTPQQVYFNTGSWTTHLALPKPEEVTPELVAWLQDPNWNAVPLHDITQFLFVLATSDDNAPPTAQLCVWEGGVHGSYRVLV